MTQEAGPTSRGKRLEGRKLMGLRVLVVEDEALVGMSIEGWLLELGCEVAGVAVRLDEAIVAMNESAFDLAVLDVNLGGKISEPIAVELRRRSIPFIVATGYAPGAFPAAFQNVPTLQKPFDKVGLKAALGTALAGDS
jgi:CheY-like chemotaxis protein